MNDDLISRQSVINDIQDLLKSPYVNDDNMGRFYKKDMAEIIIDLCVNKQPSVNQWIDLDNKYPNDKEYVLVWCKGYFIDGVNEWEECQCYGIGYVNGNKWTVYQCKNTNFITVIAWMPLPKPYNKEVE